MTGAALCDDVVVVQNLVKHYGNVKAVDGVSFSVRRGEIFGIVGPNGTGKTTTIDCIAGMRRADSGLILVLGFDPAEDSFSLKKKIGIQQQESEIQDRLKVFEAMHLFSSFYETVADMETLLRQLNLWEKRDSYFSALSGGQKKRLFVAMALIGNPEIVFLDELTSGLDPQARRSVWELVKLLRDQGRTVVLSTHYMDEAQRLCDRVAVIHSGKIAALDSPADLIAAHGGFTRVHFRAEESFDKSLLTRLDGVESVSEIEDQCTVEISTRHSIVEIVKQLDQMEYELSSLRIDSPTLEDVFLNLTGRELRD